MIPRPAYDEYETKTAALATYLAGAFLLAATAIFFVTLAIDAFEYRHLLYRIWLNVVWGVVSIYTEGSIINRLRVVMITLYGLSVVLGLYGINRWILPSEREGEDD
jgi:hypothetical protein